MERIGRLYTQLIRYLSIGVVGYLFLQGLFTICTIQRVTERTFYVKNQPLYAIAGIGIAVLILSLIYRYGVDFLRRHERTLVWLGMAVSAVFLLWWMGQTQFWYWGDEEKIFQYAQMYADGDYSGWTPGGYPYMWTHQNGLILFVAFLLELFELSQVYVIFRILNIVFYELTLLLMWLILRRLFPDARVVVVQMAMLLLFFPYGFYCVMYYGNVIGMGLGVMAIYFALRYLDQNQVKYLCLCGASMIGSIVFKQNNAIIFVGIVLMLMMQPLLEKGMTIQKAGWVIALVAVVCIGMQLPNWVVELQSGIDLSQTGNSKYAHIAMGLQDSEDAPGWYNTYNEQIFIESGYNREETARIAKASIAASLEYYAEHPMEGWSFLNRKIASQWNNPTFEGFHMQNARSTSKELSPLVKSVINDGGKVNILLTLFLDIYESVILFGVLLYLIARKDGAKELLFATLLIGGFVFFAVWEAKGRYVAPFYFMIIPYAAEGYRKLYEGGRRFERTKKATLVVAVAALVVALCDVPLVNNTFKLGTQSEEYYEYIHEFNDNFENLRF